MTVASVNLLLGHSPDYPLAPDAVFHTVNGEGEFLGVPQVFIRLAGCPVGCPTCDTIYTVASRASAKEIAARAADLATPATRWAWITGGEPAVHDLRPLTVELKRAGFAVAVATSGVRELERHGSHPDFVSVSPHKLDASWVQRSGQQLNLVFGLNGLSPEVAERPEWMAEFASGFGPKYVTPMYGDVTSLAQCVAWVNRFKGWKLGVQAHRAWGLA